MTNISVVASATSRASFLPYRDADFHDIIPEKIREFTFTLNDSILYRPVTPQDSSHPVGIRTHETGVYATTIFDTNTPLSKFCAIVRFMECITMRRAALTIAFHALVWKNFAYA